MTTPTPDPAVIAYLRDAPPPCKTLNEDNYKNALVHLDLAARLATSADAAGVRWTPGLSIVIVRREGGSCRPHYSAYGTKAVGAPGAPNVPINEDTLFPCASLSKPVSASLLVAAALRRKAALNWEAPVPKPEGAGNFYHLAHSPAKQTTLRQWLSHLSGMPDHAGDLIEDMNPEMTRHDLIEKILAYQTGINLAEQHYTNMGFTIGCFGAAVGLGGSEWDAFALAELKALGMSQSTYGFVSVYRDPSNRAFPHQGKPSEPELLSLDPTGWTWHVVPEADERNPRRQAPAGSLLSSATDLGTFIAKHLDKAFGDAFPPRNPTTAEGRYSLGWNVANHSGEKGFEGARNAISFNHSGAFSLGAGTFLRFDPDMDIGIAILSNGEPTGVPEALGQLFFKTLYGQGLPAGCDHATLLATARSGYMGMLYGKKIANYDAYHAKPRLPIPDRIKVGGEAFNGKSDYFGCTFTVERVPDKPGDSLYLSMGMAKDGKHSWRFSLQCIEDTPSTSTFVYETRGENEVGLSAIRFTWQNSVITEIADDWLGEQGPGLGTIKR